MRFAPWSLNSSKAKRPDGLCIKRVPLHLRISRLGTVRKKHPGCYKRSCLEPCVCLVSYPELIVLAAWQLGQCGSCKAQTVLFHRQATPLPLLRRPGRTWILSRGPIDDESLRERRASQVLMYHAWQSIGAPQYGVPRTRQPVHRAMAPGVALHACTLSR